MKWLRKQWVWMRMDWALFFTPADLKEATLECWYETSLWQQRENEQWEWKQKSDAYWKEKNDRRSQ